MEEPDVTDSGDEDQDGRPACKDEEDGPRPQKDWES